MVELLSLLIQEVWLGRPSPRQFLTYLLYLSEQRCVGSTSEVSQRAVETAVTVLGGTEIVISLIELND